MNVQLVDNATQAFRKRIGGEMANASRDHGVERGALFAALTVTFVAAVASESTTARGLMVNGAQAPPRANTALRFDVASIKQNTSAEPGSMIRPEPGGRFVATNMTARIGPSGTTSASALLLTSDHHFAGTFDRPRSGLAGLWQLQFGERSLNSYDVGTEFGQRRS